MKLLFVNACLRKDESRTLVLCKSYLNYLKQVHKELEIQEVNLANEKLVPMDGESMELRNQRIAKGDFNQKEFELAKQFAEADFILVGAPFWDMSFPSALRVYMEHISVNQIAFHYVEDRSEGLCKAKEMVYLSTAGGFVPEFHIGELYMKQMCQLYGIENFKSYCLEGLDIEGINVKEKLDEAKNIVRELK